METFTIRYYMETTGNAQRILRFEREARFQSTPHKGSSLSLEDDSLVVDYVTFEDNGPVILTVEPFLGVQPDNVESTIAEMVNDYGWTLASDTGKKRKSEF